MKPKRLRLVSSIVWVSVGSSSTFDTQYVYNFSFWVSKEKDCATSIPQNGGFVSARNRESLVTADVDIG